MRHFQLPDGRSLELDDRDFRAMVHSNREEVMRMLGVKRVPPRLVLEINEGGNGRVRLQGAAEESRQAALDAALDDVIDVEGGDLEDEA